jgi:nicotinate-nucleotide adenylyltransferase
MKTIALFGTSADPPTIAHQEIISWLALRYDEVAVWASDNPFKTHGASLEQRSQMLELLIEEIEPTIGKHAQVYRNLSNRRTFESLITARTIWGDADFILTIGADLVTQLPKWYRIAELLTQVKLLIVPRNGSKIEPNDLETLTNLGAQLAIVPLDTPAISSTAIRTHHSSQGLTPKVATYIDRYHLYSHS